MRTINSADSMEQEDRTGSLVKDKDADFIVIDKNIVELYAEQNFDKIAEASVRK